MKVSWVVVLCAVFVASQSVAAEKIQLKTDKEKLSYTKGWNTGNSFKRQKVEVDQKSFLQGVEDSLSDGKTLLTVKEMVEIEENFQRARVAKREEEKKQLSEKNKKEGAAFFAANAKKEGIVTLPSGLQYKVITEGKGSKPKADDKVKVNYRMMQIDGTLIEDTDKRPEHPPVMPVGGDAQYIPAGWTEALQLMREGSKWQIFIPSKLGFGENGMGPIGPNEAILFDVELVSIEKNDKAEKTEKTQTKKKK